VNDIAIRIEKLSKKFYIGQKQEKYKTLRDTITGAFTAPLRKAGNLLRGHATGAAELNEEIWALEDVSFDVRKGEVIGIIGRNGAGKSTLLKILSRITEPTKGYAEICGRVGSLLEVGTGFHPELTGRENVFLNGAILGMRRAEIERNFDEIVAFAEVAKFIDTPVKHYSSGMYLRLAFAVAAHLETEILLVDEVLAVGDIAFQRKCLGKMEDVAQEGRTVLFVSHNMGAVENLCQSGIWIEKGKVAQQGEISSIVKAYLRSEIALAPVDLSHLKRKGNGQARIIEVRILNSDGQRCDTFLMGEDLIVEFDVEAYEFLSSLNLTLEVKRVHIGMNVLHLKNEDCGLSIENVAPGPHRFRVKIPNCMLYPSSYNISLHVGTENARVTVDHLVDFMSFTMIQSGVTKRTSRLSQHKQAIFYVPSEWSELPVEVSCHE
jgi:lipopolysaccharide transport system ATP-binding protein